MSEVQKPPMKFPAADGIRGLAVLIVLIVHAMVIFFPNTYDSLAGAGKIGVWLFFALSAFLLTNNFIEKGFGFHSLLSYIIGRIIRIIPLYILTLLVYCAFGYFSLEGAWTLFKLNSPWGHLWTIAVEFKFYFLLPFIAYLLITVQRKNGMLPMLLVALLIIIIQQAYYPFYKVKPSSTDMTGYISAFIPGMCCALLIKDCAHRKIFAPSMACLIIMIGIVISVPKIRQIVLGIPMDGYLLDKHVHFSIAWSIMIFFALSSTGVANKIFCLPLLKILGKWSFSIYLFHWLIYTEIVKNHLESAAWSVSSLFLAILAGGFIYSVIEKPLEKTRHYIMNLV